MCRVELDFKSTLFFLSILGFCAGVFSIPFTLIAQYQNIVEYPARIFFIIATLPFVGLLNGCVYGLLGFWLFRWLAKRVNITSYTGNFTLLKDGDSQTLTHPSSGTGESVHR